ncbi:hypothetical protein FO519_006889 [Halicephalobus sp. NKZ332]|nr:hypothetical protein FO519_006889 [Halicephalobus sp. NKZ332]
MLSILSIIVFQGFLISISDSLSLIKLAQDLCKRNPEASYCKPIVEEERDEIRRAPLDFSPLTPEGFGNTPGKSPLAIGKSIGNTANFEVPGLGTLGLGASSADIAKFIPSGASDSTPNEGTFQIGDSEQGFSQGETGTGRLRERHGRISVAGLGTFDVGRKSENGGMIENFLNGLIPKIPEPPGGIENPRPSSTLINSEPQEVPSSNFYYSNAYEGDSKKYEKLMKDFERKTKLALDNKSDEIEKKGENGFVEQEGFEEEEITPQVLTVNQLRSTVTHVPISQLGLQRDQIEALCQKFSVIAAQYCYGTKIPENFIEKCRSYSSDCAAFIEEKKPLGAIANSFSSNVGLTYFNVGVNGIPYYAVNEEGSVGVGHNGKVDFGSWGGGYSDSLGVKDFWSQTGEFGANWYEGLYGYKTGWRVPIVSQLGIEGGGGTHVHVPIKEGSLGQPIQVSNGYHVGPYVGLAESVGVDWYNGGVSSSQGFSLPIVGVNGNAGTSIGFPSLGTAMRAMGLGNVGVADAIGLTKNPLFSRLEDKDVSVFQKILGSSNVKTTEIDGYNQDWMKWYKGTSRCVVLPESTEQVSEVLKHCYERRLAVVPQSGNTGLVGASVPVFDEVVVSLRKLNKYYHLDTISGILECDSGFILEELDQKLAKDNYMVPLDLGARGSCLIGGNVSTCAGGVRLLRYGSMHANVVGLDVVLPDEKGTILKLGNGLRKDNTSIHSHHLFIGSEGQLGVVTRVQLLVVPRPTSIHSALIGVNSFENVKKLLRTAKIHLSEILSSFELMDRETLECLEENEGMKSVISTNPRFQVLVETSGSNPEHDSSKFQNFLEHCLDSGLADDGVLAESSTEAAKFWKLRETIPLSLVKDGYVYKNDVSLRLDHFYEIVDIMREKLGKKATRVICYGHVGDGNAHINMTSKEFSDEVYSIIYPFFYEWVASKGGSISAEHGIGRLKRQYRHLGKSEDELFLNQKLKKLFDPRGILSPYKLIDALEQN